MAATTCICSARSPATHQLQEPAQQQDEEAAPRSMVISAYDLPKRKTSSRIVRRRRSEEEEGTGGEGAGEVYWEGMVKREIEAGVDEVWERLGTFGAMKRWYAAAEVCKIVEGREGEAGCVRYCAGGGRWVKEKLLELEPAERRCRYMLIDSSYGFQGYEATLAVQPLTSSAHGAGRTLARWNFRMEPVAHEGAEQVLDFLTAIFDRMMASLERAIACSALNNAIASAGPPLSQAAIASADPAVSQAVAVAN